MGDDDDQKRSIRRNLLAADTLLLNSLPGEPALQAYLKPHGRLVQNLEDGWFESALNELVSAGERYEPDGQALPSTFWQLIAAAANDLGLTDRAEILLERAAHK